MPARLIQNVQYASLYKFIVSIGVLLIVAPVVVAFFFFEGQTSLMMSKEAWDSLIPAAKEVLETKFQMHKDAVNLYYKYALGVFGCGIIVCLAGGIMWWKVQQIEDDILNENRKHSKLQNANDKQQAQRISEKRAESGELDLDLEELNKKHLQEPQTTSSEQEAREQALAQQDVASPKNEEKRVERADWTTSAPGVPEEEKTHQGEIPESTPQPKQHQTRLPDVLDYLRPGNCAQLEDACAEFVKRLLGGDYSVRRGVMLQAHYLDVVAQSQLPDFSDIIYEYKSIRHARRARIMMQQWMNQLYRLMLTYSDDTGRKCRICLMLIVPKGGMEDMKLALDGKVECNDRVSVLLVEWEALYMLIRLNNPENFVFEIQQKPRSQRRRVRPPSLFTS